MPISESEPLLRVEGLSSGYGNIRVLHEVSLSLTAGSIVALLGPNGAGKTTLLRAISGLLPSTGRVLLDGQPVNADPRWMTRHGLVHIIEGHRVFSQLSVRDNLMLAAFDIKRAERARRMDEALSYFAELTPKLDDRGGSLSGGQQQMLAVAQGLMLKPKILMLDEPSAGLSPVLVDRVLSVLTELRKNGVAVLLVEQLVQKSLAVADSIYVMARGRIELESDAKADGLAERLQHSYLG